MTAAPFDRVVVVDWSASSRPTRGRDSIWVAVLDDAGVSTTNPATRAEATSQIEQCCRRPGRVLLGVDFSLGFPAGTADALGLSGREWRAMWELLAAMIDDAEDNVNNRFEVAAELNVRLGPGPGPFWGCPPSRACPSLTPTKVDPAPLPEWRQVERGLRRRGQRPFSSWQLLGAGSVGSQSLLGIPRLGQLEQRLVAAGRTVDVWPFTGDDPTADIVVAEVWPSLHPVSVPPGRVRDEVQVIETAARIAHARPPFLIPLLDDAERATVGGEEGWILGA